MDRDQIRTLIERVEQGSGPDRELDLAIGALWPEAERPFNLTCQVQRNGKPPCFEFTGSRDATVALTEKLGFKIEQINETYDLKGYWAKARQDRRRAVNGKNCATMERAILSAMLRAKLAMMEDE